MQKQAGEKPRTVYDGNDSAVWWNMLQELKDMADSDRFGAPRYYPYSIYSVAVVIDGVMYSVWRTV